MTPDELDRWLLAPPAGRRPLVMGVVNVTPDSFSDGGDFLDPRRAADHAAAMVAAGADWVDVGGESTRPGSAPVPDLEQIARVVPVLRAIAAAGGPAVVCSVDTTRSAVAAAALDAGAAVVNDVSAGRDDAALLPLVGRRAVPVVLMHMLGTPATMQIDPQYADVTAEVAAFLAARARAAEDAGVSAHRVILDPGIGFGKTVAHNLQLLRELPRLSGGVGGRPLLVGTSRKGFVGRVTGVSAPADRVFGTAATVAWAVANGVAAVRVHDVGPMVQVVRMVRAILTGAP
jgi:dihydropteroate synthase